MSGLDARAIAVADLAPAPFPPVQQEFRVLLAEAAFDRAVARGDAELTREIGGVLVGRVLRDTAGPYVVVDTTIDALHAEEKGTELTFTHATWKYIHEQMDAHYPERRIVGWYHTHPGFGIFLSDRDVFIHRQFFDLPYQIALVYDPKSREHGLFAWRDNEPVRCRRYFIGAREHLWDGAREARPAERAALTGATDGDAMQDTNPHARGMDSTSLTVAAGTLLMLGALGGFWFGQREVRSVIVAAQTELLHAQTRGAESLARELDANLLGLVRNLLGAESLGQPLDQALAAIQRGHDALTEPESEAARVEVQRGLQLLGALRQSLGSADQRLRELEVIARATGVDPRDLQRSVGEQRVALGQLYLDLAQDCVAKSDPGRARRLLLGAVRIDPGNAELYQKQLEGLGQE